MFLATTANQKYWDKNRRILFLGEWCRLYSQKHIWSGMDHEVLPSPWYESEKLVDRFFYLQSVQEKYLNALASRLNKIHGENHSLRYWRIILGPWLIVFVGIIYDRYLSIRRAIDSNLVGRTWLPPMRPEQWAPASQDDFVAWTKNDNFNLYLYGRIIDKLGQIPYDIREDAKGFNLEQEKISITLWDKTISILRYGSAGLSELTRNVCGQAVICSINAGLWGRAKLQFLLGQPPCLSTPKIVCRKFPFNQIIRNGLEISQGTNEFESLLEGLIVEQIPTGYVEGFKDVRQRTLDAFPRKAKVILAEILWSDDSCKIWVAHQTSLGAKLVLCQHGGGFGSGYFVTSEIHDRAICDKYFTWGWMDMNDPKLRAMSSPLLSKPQKPIKPDPGGAILLVSNSTARYFGQLDFVVNNLQVPINLEEQARFLKAVCPEVFKNLLVRLFPLKYGWDEQDRLADSFPSLKTYQGSRQLSKQLRKSRLVVHFFNSTTFLETMSMNFPTILYFDRFRAPLRLSAQPFYDDLLRVKIFHTAPESAANWVNEIYEDPLAWWMSSETQGARDRFCEQFARVSSSVMQEWAEELSKLTRG